MADEPLLLKQVIAVIDNRTTVICLSAAGQIQPVEEPFDTLNGLFDHPPFHISCRDIVGPWMSGFVNDVRRQANLELKRRPLKERRKADERYRGSPGPPPVDENRPVDEQGRMIPRPGGTADQQPSTPPPVPALSADESAGLAAEVFRRLALTVLASAGLPNDDYLVAVKLVLAASGLADLPEWLRRLLARLGVR